MEKEHSNRKGYKHLLSDINTLLHYDFIMIIQNNDTMVVVKRVSFLNERTNEECRYAISRT